MKKAIVVIVAAVLSVNVGTAWSQQLEWFRAGLRAFYSTGPGDLDGSTVGWGAQAEIPASPNIAIALSLTRLANDEVTLSAWDGQPTSGISITNLAASLVGRVRMTDRLHGYLLGGVNYNFLNLDSNGLGVDIDNKLGYHLGAGVNLEIAPRWEMFGEYRYNFLEGQVTGEDISQEVNLNQAQFTVGINFLF